MTGVRESLQLVLLRPVHVNFSKHAMRHTTLLVSVPGIWSDREARGPLNSQLAWPHWLAVMPLCCNIWEESLFKEAVLSTHLSVGLEVSLMMRCSQACDKGWCICTWAFDLQL